MLFINWNRIGTHLVISVAQCVLSALVHIVWFLDIRIGVLHKPASCRPSQFLCLRSSKEPRRRIHLDIYEPSSLDKSQKPFPVHINFHGSAFVLPCHGSDAELCAYLCSRLGCIVVDADYAKGPKYPYPAALDDALDVLSFVASQPHRFDLTKVTIGGFSAGANIAILAALRSANGPLPVKSIVAWYPPTNMTRRGSEERELSPFLRWLYQAFRSSYLPEGIDRRDPRVSPLFADSKLFPSTTLIVGENDKLLIDSVELANKLTADGVDCVLYTIPGATHAWERFVKKDTALWVARDEALRLTETRLREVYCN
ncbi:alpha/beta-hydrolase [Sanghuangporus baumii]|uniref:Alpha/beta-hydrolase n=1 Tax=Sanghuangporus baumii TaxID=108892 RepID=A0A9Q5N9S1_SANBA|nr:alpha/beta-hydrolase [Sanghuangporus baumii]